jgi:hypothetical protein
MLAKPVPSGGQNGEESKAAQEVNPGVRAISYNCNQNQ